MAQLQAQAQHLVQGVQGPAQVLAQVQARLAQEQARLAEMQQNIRFFGIPPAPSITTLQYDELSPLIIQNLPTSPISSEYQQVMILALRRLCKLYQDIVNDAKTFAQILPDQAAQWNAINKAASAYLSEITAQIELLSRSGVEISKADLTIVLLQSDIIWLNRIIHACSPPMGSQYGIETYQYDGRELIVDRSRLEDYEQRRQQKLSQINAIRLFGETDLNVFVLMIDQQIDDLWLNIAGHERELEKMRICQTSTTQQLKAQYSDATVNAAKARIEEMKVRISSLEQRKTMPCQYSSDDQILMLEKIIQDHTRRIEMNKASIGKLKAVLDEMANQGMPLFQGRPPEHYKGQIEKHREAIAAAELKILEIRDDLTLAKNQSTTLGKLTQRRLWKMGRE